MTLAFPVAVLLSVPITAYMQAGKGFRQFLVYSALLRLAAMVAMLFAKTPVQYIALIFLFYLPEAILGPTINYILAANYSDGIRGMRFGIANSVLYFSGLMTALCAGKILDVNQEFFRQIYFVVGALGAAGGIALALIPASQKAEPWQNPITKTIQILKQNREFRLFELNFFIYGIGFLLLTPVIPLYLVDVMKMSYTEISYARGFIGSLGLIAFSPFAGRIHDRLNPFDSSAKVFALISLFPILLFVGMFAGKQFVFLAYIVYSFAMAGISIVWNLGTIHFAARGEEISLQAIHLTLTGVRGIFAPLFGFLAMNFAGYWAPFLLSFLMFGISAILMAKASKKIAPVAPRYYP